MADTITDYPTRRTIPAAGAPAPQAFPVASVFHLGASMAPPPEPEATPAEPTDAPAPAAPPTKVELAIAYVKQYGEASRAELAAAMGLESDSHVKSFLKTPLAKGLLHAEGDRYTVGTGQPQSRPRRARSTTRKASPRPRSSTKRPAALAAAPAPAAHKTSPTAVAQILVGGIGISVREDGGVSISANGSAVDLTADQANIMRAFDALLAAAPGVTA
ncbi:hypothetical protein PO002_05155 [Cupriavidus necator]|uniref:hypothetical protein n=1 Tax=Cupriavidus necator TaxID=106590 RepID=UPI0039C26123